ncbi:MAG: GNAT family N-acetyltransferase [Candidatus Eremiobacteraeota bacterium]|nr:GNAT family N-acetyltransferase [Candidatus Eremiobacteraeota bacterium]MCW5872095.1 GNAT family N-acetyltransferase [Candidatus Eremiobacteraeota bacterium]
MPILETFLPHGRLRDGDLRLRILSTSPPDPVKNYVATYHFGMFLEGRRSGVGGIELRLGDHQHLIRFGGQIGYAVHPDHRGQGLAARSLRLLFPLARRHGFAELWITCDPDNFASRRTCERAGAVLQEIVDLPETHEMYARGSRQKCRYRILL